MQTATMPATAATTSQVARPAIDERAATPSDYETFLRMLTTQLRNQDPMDPADSSEFAVQLATFSGVEQQVKTNDFLAAITSQMAISGMGTMASWVGMEARAPAAGYFDGSPVTISPNPVLTADRAELVVSDSSGNEVQRMPIPVTSDPIDWAGVTSDGGPLPNGVYSFDIVSYSGDQEILREPADIYSTVQEVRSEGGETILILQGGVPVPASAVTALRNAGLT